MVQVVVVVALLAETGCGKLLAVSDYGVADAVDEIVALLACCAVRLVLLSAVRLHNCKDGLAVILVAVRSVSVKGVPIFAQRTNNICAGAI